MLTPSVILSIQKLCSLHVGPIDLDINAQQCIGLSGSSGCGKSILLRAIADLTDHTGKMFLKGESYSSIEAPDWRRRVQLVPAESLWWHSSVSEHFQQPINQQYLSLLALKPKIEQQAVNQLSTGQKQRLAILRSLEKKPQVLLLDEPTASLDRDNTERVEALISTYLSTANAAAIWVSHDPEQLTRVANQGYKLVEGQLVTASSHEGDQA
ncbi:ABC transporter ATP-binding protein [Alkalimarinus sediminis]|uniref:ATP-binding cassette domain-containing protein n=1 Tax=Alkalimarinus sediminis TaxID=1632866 RepID=A0A9E8KQB6_9ALTE|nr:ATP-binding cassette domain-containing protein [Alkalimarinus sediminis]UZW75649.1 ATP-binding cassette domain-containing protein [Alkalimarinus sediminis]